MAVLVDKIIEAVISRVTASHKVKVLNHRLEPFSKQKNGIFGTHQLLTVEVKDESSDEDQVKALTFFVKTLPDSPVVKNNVLDESTFVEEVRFYNEVRPVMVEGHNTERWSPRCYFASRDTLVFEDLRFQGYNVPKHNLLDEPSLKSALSTLARFHASSLITEARLGKTLKQAYPEAFEEKMYTNLNRFGKATIVGFDTISIMAERFGLDSSLVPKMYDRIYWAVRAKQGSCNVICHGDLWMNNLMFDSSDPPKCVLVDFQILRYASPTLDFGMFLFLHTTPQYRKKSELDIFKHYYLALRDILLQSNVNVNIPSYKSILKDYQERRLVGMAYGALYLPGIYLKPEDLVKIMNDPAALEKWFFHNRIDLITANMDVDSVYENKMKEIINEMFEEGTRIFIEQ